MREGWTYKKLNEVCDKGSSNIVINKLEDNNGDYPLYGASGLVKNVDFYHQDKPYIGIVKDGAGVGRVNTYPAYSSLVGTMQYIFAKDECLLDYIKYFLVKLDLSHCVSGATIPHIYFKDYGKERIPVPSLSEQQSIVAELDKINELISLKKAQLSDLDNLAQSIFYDMFGDPIENEKGWEVKKLGEMCTCITKGTTPTTLGFSFTDTGVNFVKVESFIDGQINNAKLAHITNECNMALSRSQLQNKDLLICIAGATIGKMAVVDSSILPANTNQACAIVRLRNKNHLRFIRTFIAIKLKEDIIQMGKGVAQPNLSLGQLREFLISVPPLSLQQEFAKRIELIEQQKAQISSTIKDLETLLASRMQYWFD